MTAIGKGVKHDLERALALILIVKHHTSLNPIARLRLNKFQAATEVLLNTAQISHAKMADYKIIWHSFLAGLEIKFAIPTSEVWRLHGPQLASNLLSR